MSFGLLTAMNKRTIRGAINPLDRSTIVSIFPKDINETKPTIQPGNFMVPAGSYENPSILVVTPSSWWKEYDLDQPLLEITNSSIEVAASFVRDYSNGLQACDMSDNIPGIFFLLGSVSVTQLKKDHVSELNQARFKQNNWYMRLVKMADTDWARSNGNPLAVSDLSRLAARELNLNDKEWLKDYQTVTMVRCAACGVLKNPNYPICANCKAVSDPEAVKKLDLKFAS